MTIETRPKRGKRGLCPRRAFGLHFSAVLFKYSTLLNILTIILISIDNDLVLFSSRCIVSSLLLELRALQCWGLPHPMSICCLQGRGVRVNGGLLLSYAMKIDSMLPSNVQDTSSDIYFFYLVSQ